MGEIDKEIEFTNDLATKIKVPKNIREAIYTKLFKNLCMAISIFIYFIFVNLGYMRLDAEVFEADLHMFAAILIVFTILIIEMSYKKNDKELALCAVEVLVLSIITLFMPYVFFHRGTVLKFLYGSSAIYISIYYVIKCIVIYVKEVKKYKEGLSDIKEIIEDNEPESYLEESNERKFENYQDEDEMKMREKEDMLLENRSVAINKKTKDKKVDKKESTKEKVEGEAGEKKDNKETSKKKRGRKPKVANYESNTFVEEEDNSNVSIASKSKTSTKKKKSKTEVKSIATSNKGKRKGEMKND